MECKKCKNDMEIIQHASLANDCTEILECVKCGLRAEVQEYLNLTIWETDCSDEEMKEFTESFES